MMQKKNPTEMVKFSSNKFALELDEWDYDMN